MQIADESDDPFDPNEDVTGRRMHKTPRSVIADLVETLRDQGWEIELEEQEIGEVAIFAEHRSATEGWPDWG